MNAQMGPIASERAQISMINESSQALIRVLNIGNKWFAKSVALRCMWWILLKMSGRFDQGHEIRGSYVLHCSWFIRTCVLNRCSETQSTHVVDSAGLWKVYTGHGVLRHDEHMRRQPPCTRCWYANDVHAYNCFVSRSSLPSSVRASCRLFLLSAL